MASLLPSSITSWFTAPSTPIPPTTHTQSLLSPAPAGPPPPTQLDAALAKAASAHEVELRKLLQEALKSNRRLEVEVEGLREEVSGRTGGWNMAENEGKTKAGGGLMIGHWLVVSGQAAAGWSGG